MSDRAAGRGERRSSRAVGAALGILLLLSGLSLPLLGLAFADETAPFCCRPGRCCCAGEARAPGDGQPCLRRGCGCEQPDAVVVAAPLRIDAVPTTIRLTAPAGVPARAWVVTCPTPLARPEEPPVPPPRCPLPA